MRSTENVMHLSKLSKIRHFLFLELEELQSVYMVFCGLNDPDVNKMSKKIGLSVTMNKVIKEHIITAWIIALCKIYEYPSKDQNKNQNNISLRAFLKEMIKQLEPLIEQQGWKEPL